MSINQEQQVNRNNLSATMNDRHVPARQRTEQSAVETLEERCKLVIVANLERFPPEALSILSSDEWDSIVRLRHERTRPCAGTGGLDGTGRIQPAIMDRFMADVERANPHFAESLVVDRFVWKDCVAYKFRAGGLTRPPALMYPWPVLVDRTCRLGDGLLALLKVENPSEGDQDSLAQHAFLLSESPMNVSLLQASGVGKSVKKFIKICTKGKCALDLYTERPVRGGSQSPNKAKLVSPLACLEQTLQRWKTMAASSGVAIKPDGKPGNDTGEGIGNQEDLAAAETCQTWRALFSVLQHREEKRRESQGQRMRELRKNLATGRPRVIKVRPTKPRYEKILDRPNHKASKLSSVKSGESGNNKMKALRKESAMAASLQKSCAKPAAIKKAAGFGAAVSAYAGTGKKSAVAMRPGQTVSLPGGRKMKIPAKGGRKSHSIFAKHRKPGPK